MMDKSTRRSAMIGMAAGLGSLAAMRGTQALGARSEYQASTEIEGAAKVSGKLTYAGPPIDLEKITVAKDSSFCGGDDRFRQAVRIAENGELADCVVQITGMATGKPWSPMQDEAKVFQVDCSFQPYVQVVRKNALLHVINLDELLHNVHAYEIIGKARRTIFNFSQPKAGQEDRVPMKLRRGNVVTLDCNVHNWMAGWIFTSETPYLTVTQTDGSFEISDIPPGDYGFSIWHPVLGEKTGNLAIEPGGDLDLNLVWS